MGIQLVLMFRHTRLVNVIIECIADILEFFFMDLLMRNH